MNCVCSRFHQPAGSNCCAGSPAGASAADAAASGAASPADAGFAACAAATAASSAADIELCANAPNARSVASVARCTSSAWIADCSIPRLSFSHCSTARRSVIRLSSSSTFVSGDIMSDMLDSDGGSPCVAPGNGAIPPNGDIRIMSHIRSIMSAGWNPAKPAKGLAPEASVVIRASWLTGGARRPPCVAQPRVVRS
ncbi:hypothetical protein KDW40_20240 [Burkholderia cenocepacia]|nr:hypothetical protein [Burkholderia cenocepacia]MBR8328058.1 hypothetical protein [Burkholderia cenocepacia]